jgi:hypothetical protein
MCVHAHTASPVNTVSASPPAAANAGRTPAVHLSLPPPALLKPRQLWTGKQLIGAVVQHFTGGRPALTFSSGGKVRVFVVVSVALWCGSPSVPASLTTRLLCHTLA